jgi:hypothetical protein
MSEIKCSACAFPKEEKDFYVNRTAGKAYRKSICRVCDNKLRKQRKGKDPSYFSRLYSNPEFRANKSQKSKEYRRDPKNLSSIILTDTRRWDKKQGFVNDLTREWITEKISRGCLYCGETELRMTVYSM